MMQEMLLCVCTDLECHASMSTQKAWYNATTELKSSILNPQVKYTYYIDKLGQNKLGKINLDI